MNYFSKDAETALLSCVMAKPDLFASVSRLITADDFYFNQHKAIWEGIEHCADKNTAIDPITVSEAAQGDIFSYVCDIATSNATARNYESYCEVVAEHSKKRNLHSTALGLIEQLNNGASCEAVQDEISQALVDSSNKASNKPVSMGEALLSLIIRTESRYNSESSGYRTGFADLDKNMQMEGGRLIVLAGRPGTGKSTFAQNIVESNCADGVPCYIATMEMDHDEVAARIASSQTGVSTKFIADPAGYEKEHPSDEGQWEKLTVATNLTKDWPLEIDYCPGLRVSEFKTKVRAFFSTQPEYVKNKKGVMVIDYLGLMTMAGDNIVQSIASVTKELKTFAGEMGIPLILLSQLSRKLEDRQDKRPINSDLRDSGAIEQDADQILFVYRDELYYPDSNDKGIAEIIIGKNRGGSPGVVRVMSQLHRYRFADLTAQQNNY